MWYIYTDASVRKNHNGVGAVVVKDWHIHKTYYRKIEHSATSTSLEAYACVMALTNFIKDFETKEVTVYSDLKGVENKK